MGDVSIWRRFENDSYVVAFDDHKYEIYLHEIVDYVGLLKLSEVERRTAARYLAIMQRRKRFGAEWLKDYESTLARLRGIEYHTI